MAVNLEMSTQFEAPNYLNVGKPKKMSPSPARNTQYGVTSELLPPNCGNDTASHERDQLQMEKDKLQEKLSNIAEELKKPRWDLFMSSFYYVSAERKNWFDSRAECTKNGADLVIIESKEEQDFINVLRSGKSAWIGLRDQVTEGTWKWVDNTSLTTSYWWSQEPNNLNGDEDCVEIGTVPDGRPVTDSSNTWNDHSCHGSLFWICEKSFPI
ncbi:CD209 antigen-like protein 2 isoform X2 [Tachysurus fulvidraco]|uniref:CD209 antigen-like protein 2 isoform X2 n=1 Tax=Tachysurus fulvidraco TaxID=1234273 RepID=UPI000F4E167F|nr:CD209 antigen-like protein 2 isoform X2 [Tachysurus fulvidraco]